MGVGIGLAWAPVRMRLAGMKEISDLLGLSSERADQLTHADGFPRPIDTLAMGRVWDRRRSDELGGIETQGDTAGLGRDPSNTDAGHGPKCPCDLRRRPGRMACAARIRDSASAQPGHHGWLTQIRSRSETAIATSIACQGKLVTVVFETVW